MIINCFASGSAGNLYSIEGYSMKNKNRTLLLLECGLSMADIQQCLGTGITNIDGILLTHEHMDHARSVQRFLRIGIDVYTSEGTAKALNIFNNPFVHIIKSEQPFNIKGITIMPFAAEHDASEPLGFVLRDSEDITLFATDTYNIKFNTHISKLMIECNHSYKIIMDNTNAGILNKDLAKRLIKSHMSLENLKTWLSKNHLSCLKEIFLLHLSKINGDAKTFIEEIETFTGVPVYVADENILKNKTYYVSSDNFGLIPNNSDRGRFFTLHKNYQDGDDF